MKDIILPGLRLLRHGLSPLADWTERKTFNVILFDSSAAAREAAFMLGGQWDECNGVVLDKYDEIAINTTASLVGAQWCLQGACLAFLIKLATDEFLKRYADGERNFVNANLRCAVLNSLNISEVNLSWAKLNLASFIGASLSGSDLTAADLREANLSGANLSKATLARTNLSGANLSKADLKEADLRQANLSGANLCEADLRGASVCLADLRGADLSQAYF